MNFQNGNKLALVGIATAMFGSAYAGTITLDSTNVTLDHAYVTYPAGKPLNMGFVHDFTYTSSSGGKTISISMDTGAWCQNKTIATMTESSSSYIVWNLVYHPDPGETPNANGQYVATIHYDLVTSRNSEAHGLVANASATWDVMAEARTGLVAGSGDPLISNVTDHDDISNPGFRSWATVGPVSKSDTPAWSTIGYVPFSYNGTSWVGYGSFNDSTWQNVAKASTAWDDTGFIQAHANVHRDTSYTIRELP